MRKYIFFHKSGGYCRTEAEFSRLETWPYRREEIKEVYLDCTGLFLSRPVSVTNRHESERLRELLDCITARYKEKLKLDFALDRMRMEKSRFCEFFRNQTGMSFVAYINKVRIEQAARLVVETDEKLETIGFDCGFDSPSHFYKCFKEHYEVSPGRLRQVSSVNINRK